MGNRTGIRTSNNIKLLRHSTGTHGVETNAVAEDLILSDLKLNKLGKKFKDEFFNLKAQRDLALDFAYYAELQHQNVVENDLTAEQIEKINQDVLEKYSIDNPLSPTCIETISVSPKALELMADGYENSLIQNLETDINSHFTTIGMSEQLKAHVIPPLYLSQSRSSVEFGIALVSKDGRITSLTCDNGTLSKNPETGKLEISVDLGTGEYNSQTEPQQQRAKLAELQSRFWSSPLVLLGALDPKDFREVNSDANRINLNSRLLAAAGSEVIVVTKISEGPAKDVDDLRVTFNVLTLSGELLLTNVEGKLQKRKYLQPVRTSDIGIPETIEKELWKNIHPKN